MSDGPVRGFVSFVGAGPGDPDLITRKGLRLLREAHVVVHDRLVPPALLAETGRDAEVIDVGKAPGRHCTPQAMINVLLVDRARKGHRVVRLKGGDPALFGRLAEEIGALRAAGIAFEVVPGVTAATAAAALAGVSLTERGTTSMVVLATGTCHSGGPPVAADLRLLAAARATLVFYMPLAGLEAIAATLVAAGRDPAGPAMVVERAGTPTERTITGRLDRIADLARDARVEPPALLITGATVGVGAAAVPVGA